MKSILIASLFLVAAFAAAAPAPKPFYIHDFVGGWVYTEKTVKTTNGESLTEPALKQYNITSTGIQGEYEVIPCDPYSGERVALDYQIMLTTPDNLTATISKVVEGEEKTVTELTSFTLDEYFPNEVYMAFGTFESKQCSVELSIVKHDFLTYKCVDAANEQATVINAKRIIIAPPKTFWQKYGMQIMMAVFMIIQMVMRSYTMPDMDKVKTD